MEFLYLLQRFFAHATIDIHRVNTSLYVTHASRPLWESNGSSKSSHTQTLYICNFMLTPSNNLMVNFPVTTPNVTCMHSFRTYGILRRKVSVIFLPVLSDTGSNRQATSDRTRPCDHFKIKNRDHPECPRIVSSCISKVSPHFTLERSVKTFHYTGFHVVIFRGKMCTLCTFRNGLNL